MRSSGANQGYGDSKITVVEVAPHFLTTIRAPEPFTTLPVFSFPPNWICGGINRIACLLVFTTENSTMTC